MLTCIIISAKFRLTSRTDLRYTCILVSTESMQIPLGRNGESRHEEIWRGNPCSVGKNRKAVIIWLQHKEKTRCLTRSLSRHTWLGRSSCPGSWPRRRSACHRCPRSTQSCSNFQTSQLWIDSTWKSATNLVTIPVQPASERSFDTDRGKQVKEPCLQVQKELDWLRKRDIWKSLAYSEAGSLPTCVESFRRSGLKATSAQLSMNSKLPTQLLFGSHKSTSPSLRQSTFDRA
jgi:hypothetical protein